MKVKGTSVRPDMSFELEMECSLLQSSEGSRALLHSAIGERGDLQRDEEEVEDDEELVPEGQMRKGSMASIVGGRSPSLKPGSGGGGASFTIPAGGEISMEVIMRQIQENSDLQRTVLSEIAQWKQNPSGGGTLPRDLERMAKEMSVKEAYVARITRELDQRIMRQKKLETEAERYRVQWEKQNEEFGVLKEQYLVMKASIDKISAEADVDLLSQQDTARLYKLLQQKYEALKEEHHKVMFRLQEAQAELIQRKDLEKQYSELQKAHMEQAEYVAALQESKSKLRKYGQTIQQQEEVIHRLEQLLSKAKSDRAHWLSSMFSCLVFVTLKYYVCIVDRRQSGS